MEIFPHSGSTLNTTETTTISLTFNTDIYIIKQNKLKALSAPNLLTLFNSTDNTDGIFTNATVYLMSDSYQVYKPFAFSRTNLNTATFSFSDLPPATSLRLWIAPHFMAKGYADLHVTELSSDVNYITSGGVLETTAEPVTPKNFCPWAQPTNTSIWNISVDNTTSNVSSLISSSVQLCSTPDCTRLVSVEVAVATSLRNQQFIHISNLTGDDGAVYELTEPIKVTISKSNDTMTQIPLKFLQMQYTPYEIVQAQRSTIAPGYHGPQFIVGSEAQSLINLFVNGSCDLNVYNKTNGFVPYNESGIPYLTVEEIEANVETWTANFICSGYNFSMQYKNTSKVSAGGKYPQWYKIFTSKGAGCPMGSVRNAKCPNCTVVAHGWKSSDQTMYSDYLLDVENATVAYNLIVSVESSSFYGNLNISNSPEANETYGPGSTSIHANFSDGVEFNQRSLRGYHVFHLGYTSSDIRDLRFIPPEYFGDECDKIGISAKTFDAFAQSAYFCSLEQGTCLGNQIHEWFDPAAGTRATAHIFSGFERVGEAGVVVDTKEANQEKITLVYKDNTVSTLRLTMKDVPMTFRQPRIGTVNNETDLVVSPTLTPYHEKTANVTLNVTNTGDLSGNFTATLRCASSYITVLAANSSRILSAGEQGSFTLSLRSNDNVTATVACNVTVTMITQKLWNQSYPVVVPFTVNIDNGFLIDSCDAALYPNPLQVNFTLNWTSPDSPSSTLELNITTGGNGLSGTYAGVNCSVGNETQSVMFYNSTIPLPDLSYTQLNTYPVSIALNHSYAAVFLNSSNVLPNVSCSVSVLRLHCSASSQGRILAPAVTFSIDNLITPPPPPTPTPSPAPTPAPPTETQAPGSNTSAPIVGPGPEQDQGLALVVAFITSPAGIAILASIGAAFVFAVGGAIVGGTLYSIRKRNRLLSNLDDDQDKNKKKKKKSIFGRSTFKPKPRQVGMPVTYALPRTEELDSGVAPAGLPPLEKLANNGGNSLNQMLQMPNMSQRFGSIYPELQDSSTTQMQQQPQPGAPQLPTCTCGRIATMRVYMRANESESFENSSIAPVLRCDNAVCFNWLVDHHLPENVRIERLISPSELAHMSPLQQQQHQQMIRAWLRQPNGWNKHPNHSSVHPSNNNTGAAELSMEMLMAQMEQLQEFNDYVWRRNGWTMTSSFDASDFNTSMENSRLALMDDGSLDHSVEDIYRDMDKQQQQQQANGGGAMPHMMSAQSSSSEIALSMGEFNLADELSHNPVFTHSSFDNASDIGDDDDDEGEQGPDGNDRPSSHRSSSTARSHDTHIDAYVDQMSVLDDYNDNNQAQQLQQPSSSAVVLSSFDYGDDVNAVHDYNDDYDS